MKAVISIDGLTPSRNIEGATTPIKMTFTVTEDNSKELEIRLGSEVMRVNTWELRRAIVEAHDVQQANTQIIKARTTGEDPED